MKVLSAEQTQRVFAEFKRKDLDDDGVISVQEFIDVVSPYLTKEDVDGLIKKINTDGNDYITFGEYLKDYYQDWRSGN